MTFQEFLNSFDEANKLLFMKPEFWCVKHPGNINDPKWQKIIQYLNKKYIGTYLGNTSNCYYGITTSGKLSYNYELNIFKGCTLLTVDEACDLIDAKELPKEWQIERNSSNYKVINEWMNKHHDVKNTISEYSGGSGWANNVNTSKLVEENLPIITFEQFLKITKMKETVKMSQKFLSEAYAAADSTVKGLIKENVDAFELSTTKDFVLQMVERYKGCPEWTAKLKTEFKDILQSEMDLSKGKFKSKNGREYGVFGTIGECLGNNLVGVRSIGKFKNKALVLNGHFDWEVQNDDGMKVLIFKEK
jgi:hypothetical protein